MTRQGTIPTIGFLRDHPRLEVLELIHRAVADGDLQPLETLPRLQFAGFAGETRTSRSCRPGSAGIAAVPRPRTGS